MIFSKKINTQELIDFTKSLAVMLKSGLTLNETLSALADQTRTRKFRKVLESVRQNIEAGRTLAESLARETNVFSPVFISLVRAGEASGSLTVNLAFLADWLEDNHELKREVKGATLYPKIVLGATFLLGGGLSIFVLPKLVPLFSQLRVKLPLATRILLGISVFLQKFWFLALLLIIGIVIAFFLLNKIKPIRFLLHSFYLRTPFFGNLLISYQLALICQLFYTLFKSGISLNELLTITADGATNLKYHYSVKKIRKKIIRGTKLSRAMSISPELFPKNLVNIVASGEKSGTLEDSFLYLSDFFLKEVKNKTKRLPTVLEPLLLIAIGLVVGFVAISIIMPIYSLTSGINQ